MSVEPQKNPIGGLTRGESAAILAVALAIFLWAAGPIWLHRWDPDTSILISYAPIPILVFAVLLAGGRFGLNAFLAETLKLAILKFGITAGFLILLWSLQSPPRPTSLLTPLAGRARRARPEGPALRPPIVVPTVFAPGSLGEVAGLVRDPGGRALAGAVVFVLEGLDGLVFAPPARALALTITPAGIVPTPLVLPLSGRCALRSADGRLHTLHAWLERDGSLFNVPVLPDVPAREIEFQRAGVGWIRCEIHPGERAPLLITRGPFFSTTEADGAFRLAGVPAGALRIGVFHGGQVAGTRRLRVVGGERSDGSIQLE